jgi:hypothetical protein
MSRIHPRIAREPMKVTAEADIQAARLLSRWWKEEPPPVGGQDVAEGGYPFPMLRKT